MKIAESIVFWAIESKVNIASTIDSLIVNQEKLNNKVGIRKMFENSFEYEFKDGSKLLWDLKDLYVCGYWYGSDGCYCYNTTYVACRYNKEGKLVEKESNLI